MPHSSDVNVQQRWSNKMVVGFLIVYINFTLLHHCIGKLTSKLGEQEHTIGMITVSVNNPIPIEFIKRLY